MSNNCHAWIRFGLGSIIAIVLGGFGVYKYQDITKTNYMHKNKELFIFELKRNKSKILYLKDYFENIKDTQNFTNMEIRCFEYDKNTFDILKRAESVTLIDNDDLESLEKIYTNLEELKCYLDWYMDAKKGLYFEYIIKSKHPNNDAFWVSYKRLNEGFNLVDQFEEANKKISIMIEILENKYNSN